MTTYLVAFNGRQSNAIGAFFPSQIFIDLEQPLKSLVPGELPLEVFEAIQKAGYESSGIRSIRQEDRPASPHHILKKEESDFNARAQKHLPIEIVSKDWVNNAYIISFYYK